MSNVGEDEGGVSCRLHKRETPLTHPRILGECQQHEGTQNDCSILRSCVQVSGLCDLGKDHFEGVVGRRHWRRGQNLIYCRGVQEGHLKGEHDHTHSGAHVREEEGGAAKHLVRVWERRRRMLENIPLTIRSVTTVIKSSLPGCKQSKA